MGLGLVLLSFSFYFVLDVVASFLLAAMKVFVLNTFVLVLNNLLFLVHVLLDWRV